MQRAFTLIELLIVIAILSILGTAITVVLNPAELLAQTRDSARLQDLESIKKSLSLTLIDNPSLFASLSSTTVYLSLKTATCPTSSLPALPAGFSYACSNTPTNVTGSGWIPLTLTNLPNLPVDPVNSETNLNYYAFIPDPTNKTFVITSLLESEKYLKSASIKDGGTDPARIEEGSPALWTAASGLVGYWSFNEGSGSVAVDYSGNNNNGNWNGTGTHYNTGKVGPYAGQFNGVNDYVSAGNIMPAAAYTKMAWVKNTSSSSYNIISGQPGHAFWNTSLKLSAGHNSSWGQVADPGTFSLNTWYFGSVTFDPAVSAGQMTLYRDGENVSQANSVPTHQTSVDLLIGSYTYGNFFSGQIDEARVYNRRLLPAEIKAIYTAQK